MKQTICVLRAVGLGACASYPVEGAQRVDGDRRADLIVRGADASGVTFTRLAALLDGAVVHGLPLHAASR
jgi:hypothetical protein